MLLQRANKYRAEPSPYQAQAMGQWVGACRHEYNHALERRQYEYRNYGFSLAYVPQAKELTVRRAAKNWLEFVSVLWQKKRPDPSKSTDDPIGIDRGVAVFAATSVGQLIDPVNAFDGIRDKLAKLQHRLARKVKFSSNWHKLKGRISRLRMHEANVRKDFLHKESTGLAKSHGVYRLEKLRVWNMTASAAGTVEEPGKNVAQKSGLNRSILDQGWGMFATFLSYKEQERGGRVEFTPAPYTSLRCPAPGCGHTHANNRPTRDWFCCEVCGYEGHADVVGAINVSQGRILPVEPPKRIRRRGRQEEAGEGAGQPWRLALLLTAVGIDLKAANLRVEAGAEAPRFSEGSMSRDKLPRAFLNDCPGMLSEDVISDPEQQDAGGGDLIWASAPCGSRRREGCRVCTHTEVDDSVTLCDAIRAWF